MCRNDSEIFRLKGIGFIEEIVDKEDSEDASIDTTENLTNTNALKTNTNNIEQSLAKVVHCPAASN